MKTLLFIGLLSLMFSKEDMYILQVEVTNLRPGIGNLMLAVNSTADKFPAKEGTLLFETYPVKDSGTMIVEIELPKGAYAISLYQDLNKNQELDTKMFGIPKEPYGFSNNPRPKFRAPRFEEARFSLEEKTSSV